MTNDPNTPQPSNEFPDPIEAELVAYLDGELDQAAAQDIEDKLATDSQLRAEADALKKSFALLDYLPRREPSPEFATRTLDKLPTAKSGTGSTVSPSQSSTRPTASPSTSIPIPLSTGTIPLLSANRGWAWLVGLAGAVAVALAGGYFGTAAARNYFQPPATVTPHPAADDTTTPDRVARLLPLYALADDLDFVLHLAEDPVLFDEDSVSTGGDVRVPWVSELSVLSRAFQSLPIERQKQILKLDQQLHALEPKERERLLHALEAYCAWMDRLPDAERRGVLSQATPGLRLKVIRDIRENQAQDAIPESIRNDPDPTSRTARMRKWEADEAERRRAWNFAREHWESIRGTRTPWPFDNPELKKQVIDYAKTVYRLDDKKSRLLPPDATRLSEALREGEEKDVWLWFGWVLYDLTPRYDQRDPIPRYEMFPRPLDGRLITDFGQLPMTLEKHYLDRPPPKQRFDRFVGKWPDFPLAVHDDLSRSKSPFAIPGLGPARVEEFAEPVRGYVTHELFPALTLTERLTLNGTEGRWPEYPRLLIRAARAHDLSIPSVMLPGKPSEWDRTYGNVPGRGIVKIRGNPLP